MEAQVPTIGTSLLAAELASVKRFGNWRPLAGHVRPRQNWPSAGRPQLRGQPRSSAHEPPGAVLAPLASAGQLPQHTMTSSRRQAGRSASAGTMDFFVFFVS